MIQILAQEVAAQDAVAQNASPQLFVSTWGLLIVIGVLLFVLTIFTLIFLMLAVPWLKAFMSGTPISMFQVIGMRFRGASVGKIINQGIAANQAGHPISWVDLERAAAQGVDIETLISAYCVCRERGEHYTLDELVLAARESRLDKLIKE